MNRSLCFLSAAALLLTVTACRHHTPGVLDTTDRPLSVRMADSELQRNPKAYMLDGKNTLKWDYTASIEMYSVLDLYKLTGDVRYRDWVMQFYDTIIAPDGIIRKYNRFNYNIDHVCPGRVLFDMLEMTGDAKYRIAMDTLFVQLQHQPRTTDGGFWHKAVYPWQMWLDGLYMGEPYYARYVSEFIPEAERQAYYDDIVHQFLTVAKHTYDPETGLYRHAWDESREQFWCDSVTGQSEHCWSRGLGWYVMGMTDALDYLPEGEGRQQVIDLLMSVFQTLPRYADRKTGMWYQVLDCPEREGNWLESTGSIMFVYSLMKCVDKGWISDKYAFLAEEWYRLFVKTFIREDEDGWLVLTDCCAGAGLGGAEKRSGTFDYYIHQTVNRQNDCKAVGPFIWASMMYEKWAAAKK